MFLSPYQDEKRQASSWMIHTEIYRMFRRCRMPFCIPGSDSTQTRDVCTARRVGTCMAALSSISVWVSSSDSSYSALSRASVACRFRLCACAYTFPFLLSSSSAFCRSSPPSVRPSAFLLALPLHLQSPHLLLCALELVVPACRTLSILSTALSPFFSHSTPSSSFPIRWMPSSSPIAVTADMSCSFPLACRAECNQVRAWDGKDTVGNAEV
ncbi:hypothetical protein RHS01_10109 [Rhizoctonia solani]|uniref:Uncharacterized protein n=1 Tax=Rhizoctonia solani TaxID=456999 RepID=A0A8H7I7P2_9AGAM|nr:hypothetical protein RHS01_10109 [Rhizoctonia solani]